MSEKRTCRQWDADNPYLIANYMNSTNEELAIALDRNEDAIRKQLNKLGLKRMLKSELQKLEKQTKAPNFFDIIDKGERVRDHKLAQLERVRKIEQQKAEEKKWAEQYMKEPEKFVLKATGPKKPVQVDSKTTIYVDANLTPEEVQKVIDKFNSRRNG